MSDDAVALLQRQLHNDAAERPDVVAAVYALHASDRVSDDRLRTRHRGAEPRAEPVDDDSTETLRRVDGALMVR